MKKKSILGVFLLLSTFLSRRLWQYLLFFCDIVHSRSFHSCSFDSRSLDSCPVHPVSLFSDGA